LQTVIDVLKVDIEGGEFESLEGMFETDVLQKHVKQFIWESHLSLPPGPVGTQVYYRTWKAMKQLEDIGFRRIYATPIFLPGGTIYVHNGEVKTCCHELAYINTAFWNHQ
jgi:Methyltransferase FkbM domain